MLWDWFRIESDDGSSSLEVRKLFRGNLEVTVKHEGEWTSIVVDRPLVNEMINWLVAKYPAGKELKNVIKLERALSVQDPEE
jgi:hypothetical protein